MSKSVMISINPRWCELIASGKKTVEVRKSRPKLETPFKCYIYETKGKTEYPTFIDEEGHEIFEGRGQVIGEFVCDEMQTFFYDTDCGAWAEPNAWIYYMENAEGERTCMEYDEFAAYGNGKTLYGWHISDLKIYDTPKKLGEFKRHDPTYDFSIFGEVSRTYSINRPPQNWCYVEEAHP